MMAKSLSSCFIAFVICSLSASGSQPPEIEWSKTSTDNWYEVKSVRQTSDGGYILAGTGGDYAYLMKTDPSGNKIWDKSFRRIDNGHFAQETNDGNYIFVGNTYSGRESGVWLIKTDSDGNELWNKTFEEFDRYIWRFGFDQTEDGGYIIAGEKARGEDVLVIRTDSSGHKLWDVAYGQGDDYSAYSVKQTTDGGYIITGDIVTEVEDQFHKAQYRTDIWVWKLNSSGVTESSGFVGWEGRHEEGFSIEETNDAGYIITGRTTGEPGKFGVAFDAFLLKTDATGSSEWCRTFSGSSDTSSYAVGNEVRETDDGGYIVVGGKDSGNYRKGGFSDIWLVKTDNAGNVAWSKTFGEGGKDEAASVQQTDDGGYIVAGVKDENHKSNQGYIWLIKVAAEKPETNSSDGSEAPEQSPMPGVIWSIIACLAAVGFHTRFN